MFKPFWDVYADDIWVGYTWARDEAEAIANVRGEPCDNMVWRAVKR